MRAASHTGRSQIASPPESNNCFCLMTDSNSARQYSHVQCRPLAFAALLVWSQMTAVHAQTRESSYATAALPSVVVSGSRTEQPREDVPMSMDVLEAADLNDGQINDIRGVANGLPNVSVRHAPSRFTVTGAGNTTGRDGNAGFNVRGLDGNRVLMLQDGIRLPRSYVNGNNAFGRDTVSLELMKRIELVRGPSSVLFGSDGLAGLVNFITYEPSDFFAADASQTKQFGGKLVAHAGTADRSAGLAATVASRANSAVQWMLTGTNFHAGATDTMGNNDSANVDRTKPNPQDDKGAALLGKLVFQPSVQQRHVFTLDALEKFSDVELLSSRAKAPLTAASVVDERASSALRRGRLSWHAHFATDMPWADSVKSSLSVQNSDAQQNGVTTRNDNGLRLRNTNYSERAWQASLQVDKLMPVSAQWTQKISAGLDYTSTVVSNWFDGMDPPPLSKYVPKKYFPDSRDSSTALYAQSEFRSERWSINSGLRMEQFALDVLSQDGFSPPSPTPAKALSGANVSPKFGVLFRATPYWTVYGNYASGFRVPNAAQINGFVESPTSSTFVTLLANPDLQPETSSNVEFGMRTRHDLGSLDFAIFSGNFQHLIVDKKPLGGIGTASDPLLFQTVNIDSACIQGFELKGTFEWGELGGVAVSTPFSYGQVRGIDKSTDRPLNSIDPAKLTLGLKLDGMLWNARLDATYHSAKTVGELESPYLPKPVNPPRIEQLTLPEATTVDLRMQWRLRKDLRANFAVINLTDRKLWLWSDVQGLAASSAVIDAYTQPGRHLNFSLVAEW